MNLRVLLIEDDHAIADALSVVLAEDGYEPVCAATLAEGLASFERMTPMCMVLDLNLPDGSADALLAKLTSQGRAPPTVLLSASTIAPLVAGRFGIPLIRKPFDLSELLAAIAVVVERGLCPVDAEP